MPPFSGELSAGNGQLFAKSACERLLHRLGCKASGQQMPVPWSALRSFRIAAANAGVHQL